VSVEREITVLTDLVAVKLDDGEYALFPRWGTITPVGPQDCEEPQ
jgi:hypothetical protein